VVERVWVSTFVNTGVLRELAGDLSGALAVNIEKEPVGVAAPVVGVALDPMGKSVGAGPRIPRFDRALVQPTAPLPHRG